MPEGAAASDDDDALSVDDPHRALDIDLDAPMDASQLVLPTRSHHVAKDVSAHDAAALEKKKSKDKKKKRDKDGKKKKEKKKDKDTEPHVHQHEHNHVSWPTIGKPVLQGG